jgi:hypothetical protein
MNQTPLTIDSVRSVLLVGSERGMAQREEMVEKGKEKRKRGEI